MIRSHFIFLNHIQNLQLSLRTTTRIAVVVSIWRRGVVLLGAAYSPVRFGIYSQIAFKQSDDDQPGSKLEGLTLCYLAHVNPMTFKANIHLPVRHPDGEWFFLLAPDAEEGLRLWSVIRISPNRRTRWSLPSGRTHFISRSWKNLELLQLECQHLALFSRHKDVEPFVWSPSPFFQPR